MRVVQYIKRRKKGRGKKEEKQDDKCPQALEESGVPHQEVAGPIRQRLVRDVYDQKIKKSATVVNPLSKVSAIPEPDIPEGHLLRCSGCSVIHFCEMAARFAPDPGGSAATADTEGGYAGDVNEDVIEEVRVGTDDDEERERSEPERDDEAVGDQTVVIERDRVDIAERFKPRDDDHKWCIKYVKALKKRLYDTTRAKDVLRAKYTEAKDDILKTHQELDSWAKDDTLDDEDRRFQTLLKSYEELSRKLGGKAPGVCTLALHREPFCSDPDHREEFCNVPAHGGEAQKCGVPEHQNRCPVPQDQPHCNQPEHDAEEREKCTVAFHQMACLRPLTEQHCTKEAHDNVDEEKRELGRRLDASETEIAILREQTERCKKEVETLMADLKKLTADKSQLQGRLQSAENEHKMVSDAYYALSLAADEATDMCKANKELLQERAEELQQTKDSLHRTDRKLAALQVEHQAAMDERDDALRDKKNLLESIEAEKQTAQKNAHRHATQSGGEQRNREEVRGQAGQGEERQQQDHTPEERPNPVSDKKMYDGLAYPAQAEAYVSDVQQYLNRVARLTGVPGPAALYELKGSLRRLERRLEKLVDAETEYAADCDNEDTLPVIHAFELKAGGALARVAEQIQRLQKPPERKLDVVMPEEADAQQPQEEYKGAEETGFGGNSGPPPGNESNHSDPSAATSGSASGAPPQQLLGVWPQVQGWSSGWFKGGSTHGGSIAPSAASFEGDKTFYLALPAPWNLEPDGDRISFSDYTKLITSGYVKKFKQKLADYPRFRTDFITNFHSARIPIVAKFKALAEVGGADMEEAAESVDAGQEGYGMLIRRLELLFGGKDRQMVALTDAISQCELVKPGQLKQMQALVDAVTKYQAALPPERAHEARTLQHAMKVLDKLSDELKLQYRQYCTQIGVEDEYNVTLLLRWLREVNIRHLYKSVDASKLVKKTSTTGGAAAAAAAKKNRAVFFVGDQKMEVVPVSDTSAGHNSSAAAFVHKPAGPERCWYCQDTHKLADCPEFKSKPAATRKALVHGADLCAVCLKRGHFSAECTAERCATCNGEHHSLVHGWGDGGGRGGGARGRGRGGRGRGRGGQSGGSSGGGSGGGGAAAASADGAVSGPSNNAAPDNQSSKQDSKKSSGANATAAAAQAAAAPAPATEAEKMLYGDQAKQQTFVASARVARRPPAALSREQHAGSETKPAEELPLWSDGINAYPRGSMFQFVSIAHPVSPGPKSDSVFNAASSAAAVESAGSDATSEEGQISLRFAVVRIYNKNTKTNTLVNALLDDGATLSTLSQRAAKALGLKGRVEKLEVTGYGGNVSICDAVYCPVDIESRNGSFRKDGCIAVVPDPVGPLKAVNWAHHKQRWPHLAPLTIESPMGDGQVDMIIGVDQSLFHQALQEIRGRSSLEPAARLTPAGWTVVGWTHTPAGSSSQVVLKASSYDSVCLRGCSSPSLSRPSPAEREWLISDHVGQLINVPDPVALKDGASLSPMRGPLEEKQEGLYINAGDRTAINNILKSWTKLPDGRIQVAPLWRSAQRPAPNYEEAFRIWTRTERSLHKQGVRMEYHRAIEKWIEDGHAEWLEEEDTAGYFLPHFPVIRRDKATTKVRVVANGRAQFQGKSLNDFMFSGPKVVNSLVQVLLRFRRFPFAIIVDVESMFLRVSMPEEDRKQHRFAYTNPTTNKRTPFQSVGHVFGSTGSPCIAISVLKIGACQLEKEHPSAADAVLHSSMVDDILDSVPTVDNGRAMAEGLVKIADSIGMKLHKWCANHQSMLPAGARIAEHARIEDKTGADQAGEPASAAEHKPLGLIWTAEDDKMRFQYRPYDGGQLTKLGLLKLYMALFDPLGLIMPFVMSARIMYRDLWRLGCDWDEEVPEQVEKGWKKWLEELALLDDFSFERCMHWEKGGFLAAFSDASKDAYGAAVYLVNDNGASLLYARGRVNSQEARTIPLLELLGAELAVVAAREAARALGVPLSEVIFFCDSQTAINWLRRPARDVTNHVARKVAQLREAVAAENWWFVPTDLNPADVLSRGCSMGELLHHSLWWKGPAFLRLPKEEWPKHDIPGESHPVVEQEERLNRLIGIYRAQGRPLPAGGPSPFRHLSEWSRATRAAAQTARAARLWREKGGGGTGVDSGTELSSDRLAIRLEQRALWPAEVGLLQGGGQLPARHIWSKLNASIEGGLICMNGRGIGSPVPMLSKESWLAQLWMKHVHEKQLHHAGGHKTLLSEATRSIWIVGAAVLARRVARECALCRKQRPVPFAAAEAPLPPFRCGSAPQQAVFTHVLMDECGPFLTKQGRGKAAQKRWILVVTCGATRAVHLEVVPDRTAEAVAAALVRFACRHTVPKYVLSDNAPEFAAAAELLAKERVAAPAPAEGSWAQVEWKKYPPYAPNFGGAVEAMVKLTKTALRKIIQDKEHNDLELVHAVEYITYVINSRPLTALSDDPEDPRPLTPNTFLRDVGRGASITAPITDDGLRQCSSKLRTMVEEAWTELRSSIRASSQQQHKATGVIPNIREGDVVAVLDVPPLPGTAVSMGRVERLWAGADGVPRRADVMVRGKSYHRALKSLAPLL